VFFLSCRLSIERLLHPLENAIGFCTFVPKHCIMLNKSQDTLNVPKIYNTCQKICTMCPKNFVLCVKKICTKHNKIVMRAKKFLLRTSFLIFHTIFCSVIFLATFLMLSQILAHSHSIGTLVQMRNFFRINLPCPVGPKFSVYYRNKILHSFHLKLDFKNKAILSKYFREL